MAVILLLSVVIVASVGAVASPAVPMRYKKLDFPMSLYPFPLVEVFLAVGNGANVLQRCSLLTGVGELQPAVQLSGMRQLCSMLQT